MLIPEMFEGITDPEKAYFGICPGQMRQEEKTIVTSAGWYNQVGELLGEGDLSIIDFGNIFAGLLEDADDSFIIVPVPLNASMKFEHMELEPTILAERCLYIIQPRIVHIFDAREEILERLCKYQNIPYVFEYRDKAYDIIENLIPFVH